MHYIGTLKNEILLGAIGLASTTINIFGGVLMTGMNMGMGSMIGRAHGANSTILKQNYLNKGLVCFAILYIFLVILMSHSEEIFLALGQIPEVCYYCEYYIMGILPGIFFQLAFDFLRNVLNSQEIYNEPMIIMLVGIFVQTLLCKLMIYLYEFDGVIASVNMSSFFMLCLLVVVIIVKHPEQYRDILGKTILFFERRRGFESN